MIPVILLPTLFGSLVIGRIVYNLCKRKPWKRPTGVSEWTPPSETAQWTPPPGASEWTPPADNSDSNSSEAIEQPWNHYGDSNRPLYHNPAFNSDFDSPHYRGDRGEGYLDEGDLPPSYETVAATSGNIEDDKVAPPSYDMHEAQSSPSQKL